MSVFSKTPGGCTGVLFCVALVSYSGGPNPAPAGDFSLASAPATIALVPGGASQQISVDAVPMGGFTGMVAIAITGLPTGVTAQPAALILTPGTAQNVTVTAAATVAAGSATLTFTGSSGTL